MFLYGAAWDNGAINVQQAVTGNTHGMPWKSLRIKTTWQFVEFVMWMKIIRIQIMKV